MDDRAQAEAVAKGLTEAQRAIIPRMSDGELVYPLPRLTEDLPSNLRLYRKAVAGLRQSGLAQHGPLYDQDDGSLRGSGTWLTPLGLLVRSILQEPRPMNEDREALREVVADALSGWRYIRANHGDLYGVGWDRVEHGLCDALAALSPVASIDGGVDHG